MLLTFAITVLIGSFIGLLNHLKSHGFTWGPSLVINVGYSSISSLLAVAAFAFYEELDKVIVLAIIGGYIGEAFLKSFSTKFIEEKKINEVEDMELKLMRHIKENEDKDKEKNITESKQEDLRNE